jgi:hypothetical protein
MPNHPSTTAHAPPASPRVYSKRRGATPPPSGAVYVGRPSALGGCATADLGLRRVPWRPAIAAVAVLYSACALLVAIAAAASATRCKPRAGWR